MTWTCANCQQGGGVGVLGVAAHEARPGERVRWRTVHRECFGPAGLSYGVDLSDIRSRGGAWWLEHVGHKSWAVHTDYVAAFSRIAPLGAA